MITTAAIVPPEIEPLATPTAPRYISSTTAPNTTMMIIAVIAARIRMRRRAVAKVRSTARGETARARVLPG